MVCLRRLTTFAALLRNGGNVFLKVIGRTEKRESKQQFDQPQTNHREAQQQHHTDGVPH